MGMLKFVGATSVDFPIVGADPSGPFVLKGADGLGPVPITVQMGRTVWEKAVYQGKSATLRQIIAVVGLQPNWDEGERPDDLRSTLYKLLTPRYNEMVRCEIWADGEQQAFAQGQISKMEPSLFTKDPAVQITLDCDYGYLLKPTSVVQTPVQRSSGGLRAFDVVNDGDAPAGFRAGFILNENVGTSLILSDENPLGMKIQIDGIDWMSGDRFVVDTRPGTRGVWRGAGGGALSSVLNNLNASVSEWMYLYAGDNSLMLNTSVAFDWDTAYYFAHQPAYWGV